MKIKVILIFLLMIFLVNTFVLAESDNSMLIRHKTPVVIPKNAVEISPGVFSLGSRLHEGKIVEGYAIMTHTEDFEKYFARNNAFNFNPKSSCYGFLATGAKWKTVEPYLIDPTNDVGLDTSIVMNNINVDINKWEDAANGVMNDRRSINIIGNQKTNTLSSDFNPYTLNGYNQIYFAPISQSGVIAMTVIWGIFSGPTNQRQLVEWDQIYSENFVWSIKGEAGKMDFDDIATHELGHSVGLNDLYDTRCSEQTMYGYASFGETKKRTLESGDITGISLLY